MRNTFFCCLIILIQACATKVDKKTKPNILVILVDDMGYSDLSCYGSEIKTPNIDALAYGGIRMTQFYNAARCSPSRAALLTGLYPHQAGMGHQNKDWRIASYSGKINQNAVTIAQVLQRNGYSTYQVGKWHVGNTEPYWPKSKGFDQYLTLIEGAMSYFNQWPWAKGQDTLEMRYNGAAYHAPADFFATDTFSDTAAAFINKHDQSKPFFMYLAYNAPHWPLHVKPEDRNLYKGLYDGGWDGIRTARFESMQQLGILDEKTVLTERFATVPKWQTLSEIEKENWIEKMELYAAVMHRLDVGVGKVVAALKESGQFENTLILLLSDNGACQEDPLGPWIVYPNDGEQGGVRSFPAYELPWANVSNTPYRYFKSFLHEGGIRTPFIAHYPAQIKKGQILNESVGHITDVMPTVLALAEATYPEVFNEREITPMAGESLLPTLLDQENQIRKGPIFWEHQFNRAMRDGDWKLVSAWRVPGIGRVDEWELYNLAEDPVELNDLSKTHPDKVEKMNSQYETWARKVGAYPKSQLDSLKKVSK